MDPWKHESQFGDFIAESSTFPTAPPSPSPDHKQQQPEKEDWDAYSQTLVQLQKLEAYLKHNREDTKFVAQLSSFLKGAKKITPTLTVGEQFDRLRPLRNWLFFLPVTLLEQNGGTPSVLVLTAHYYTVALLMERLFPEIGAAYFGSLSIGPVEEIARRLLSLNVSGSMEGDLQTPLSLMKFPIDTVNEFRSRMGWIQPVRTPSFPQYDPPNFYMSENSPISINTGASTDGLSYSPYSANPAFNYSTEDLSIVTADSASNSAVSPLQLSPYVNTQYLSIPSPSYGGYSPASSTFNDFGDSSSITYSDHDDFATYDMSYSATTPVLGGANLYDVGFVSPVVQAVWN
jgi:hypothetical protein